MTSMNYLKRILFAILFDLVVGIVITISCVIDGIELSSILLIIVFILCLILSIILNMENIEMFAKLHALEKVCEFDTRSWVNLERISRSNIIWYPTGNRAIVLIDFRHEKYKPYSVDINELDYLIINNFDPRALSIDNLEGVKRKNGDY